MKKKSKILGTIMEKKSRIFFLPGYFKAEEYVSNWLHKYDWRQKEAELNALPHFRLEVRGLQTHLRGTWKQLLGFGH